MAHKKKRVVVYISNPAPEGLRSTSMMQAEQFVARGRAEWLSTRLIRFISDTEKRAVQLEKDAIRRRLAEEEVAKRIAASRYGCASWGGSARKGVPWFERESMMPIKPGMVRS